MLRELYSYACSLLFNEWISGQDKEGLCWIGCKDLLVEKKKKTFEHKFLNFFRASARVIQATWPYTKQKNVEQDQLQDLLSLF